MVYLTKNEFNKQIMSFTENLTKVELQNLILEIGERLFNKKRDLYIAQIKQSLNLTGGIHQKDKSLDKAYFAEFKDFIHELREYSENIFEQEPEYDSYYHDDDEQFHFDEDTADRIQEYFDNAYDLFKTNQKDECMKILIELLPSINLFDEFELDIDITNDLLSIPLIEAYSICLNSIYVSKNKEERVKHIFDGFQLFKSKISEDFNLKTVIECDSSIIPDFNEFLKDWITILKLKKEHWTNFLLVESLTLYGVIENLVEYILQIGDSNPELFELSLEYLVQKQSYIEIETVSMHALNVLPLGEKRSLAGKRLLELGKIQNNKEWIIKGSLECFESYPSLETYLKFIENHISLSETENAKAVLLKMEKLWTKSLSDVKNEPNLGTSFQLDYKLQGLFFLGKFDQITKFCNGFGSLGWEYAYNPKRLVIPQMMAIFVNNLEKFTYIRQLCETFLNKNHLDILGLTVNYYIKKDVFKEISQKKHFDWVKNHSELRIKAILDGKHRKSYWKAALLLKALKELISEIEGQEIAKSTGERILKQYSRLSAFHREFNQSAHFKERSF